MKPDFSKYTDMLIPAIVQDVSTQKVLMLGYMNEAALEQTRSEKRITFFSRSKQRLWTKGETSGNYLNVEDILLDCDQDCLLIKATPSGQVCHTGSDTCFGETNKEETFLYQLEEIIAQRKQQNTEGSYISSLFQKGINKIAQKLGEEAVELIIEAKDDNDDLFQEEAADLLFHYLILLQAKNTSMQAITDILQARHARNS